VLNKDKEMALALFSPAVDSQSQSGVFGIILYAPPSTFEASHESKKRSCALARVIWGVAP
jgi:hypothetical protein